MSSGARGPRHRGITVRAGSIAGAALASVLVKAHDIRGFSAGAVTYFDECQVGLAIGIVNYAERLNGIQLGLVNIAKNQARYARVLPLLNAHFE